MAGTTADLLVIGAGSGGLSVAAGAAQMGARVVLLEGARMGGDCLNAGCVPSKALIAAAHAAHAQAHSAPFGVAAVAPAVDFPAVMAHLREVQDSIAPHDSQERFERLGVRVIREWGRFVSPREVAAGGEIIAARRIVIATGSSPLVPPIPGLNDVPFLTNETLWDLRKLPERLLIIGGGPIGLEMAQAFARLGSGVSVIEGARALGRDDPETAQIVLDRLRAEGVEIAEHTQAARVRGRSGAVEVETEDGRTFGGTHLLIAAGRRPNLDRLELAAAGIAAGRAGIRVDAGLRTSNRRVYAIGDAAGGLQFTHVAGYHAGLVIRSALFGLPVRARPELLPWTTYTDPELAQIGLTEAQARARHGAALEVVRVDFAASDRARTLRRTKGLLKLMVHRGRPVGVSIAGIQAGELIGAWGPLLAGRLSLRHLSEAVVPYPTLGEINKRAAGAYFSPRLFDNKRIEQVVGAVQRWLP